MKLKQKALLVTLAVSVMGTSGCDLVVAEEEVVDPVTGAVTVAPVGPPRPTQPREPRGGSGGGGWNS